MNYIDQKNARKKLTKKKTVQLRSVRKIHEDKTKYFNELHDVVLPKKQKLLAETVEPRKRAELQAEIKDILDSKEENDYYLSVAGILRDYYELDNTDIPEEMEIGADGYGLKNSKKQNIVLKYYAALDLPIPNELLYKRLAVDCINCNYCGGKDTMVESEESFACRKCCAVSNNCLLLSGRRSYQEKQEHEPKSIVDYKRINYFMETLNQIQAKENTEIPQELMDLLLTELKIEKILDRSKIDNNTIRRLLKKTGYSKYYEHIPFIINSLTGGPPVKIPPLIEEKFRLMF